MNSTQYTGGGRTYEYANGEWRKKKGQIPDAVFYNNPAWAELQRGLLNEGKISLEHFLKGDNPEELKVKGGIIYFPVSYKDNKKRLARTTALTRIIDEPVEAEIEEIPDDVLTLSPE